MLLLDFRQTKKKPSKKLLFLNTTTSHKNFLLSSRYQNYTIETYVTIEQKCCYVTLTTVENTLLKFCTELVKFRKCCRILIAMNSENEVSLGTCTLLPCRLSKQASSQSSFPKLTVKSPDAKFPQKALSTYSQWPLV